LGYGAPAGLVPALCARALGRCQQCQVGLQYPVVHLLQGRRGIEAYLVVQHGP